MRSGSAASSSLNRMRCAARTSSSACGSVSICTCRAACSCACRACAPAPNAASIFRPSKRPWWCQGGKQIRRRSPFDGLLLDTIKLSILARSDLCILLPISTSPREKLLPNQLQQHRSSVLVDGVLHLARLAIINVGPVMPVWSVIAANADIVSISRNLAARTTSERVVSMAPSAPFEAQARRTPRHPQLNAAQRGPR